MGNTHGRATAITVLTPLRRGWTLWLEPSFFVAARVPLVTKALRRLSFIHFARWSVLKAIPHNGPPQGEDTLSYRYLFFESNFNGSWDAYIDAFSHIIPSRMRAVWGGAYGFPGPLPVSPFKDYIRRNEYVADHFWSAYPEASTTMVLSALEVQERLRELVREAETLTPEQFGAAYRHAITDLQRHL
jgi:hypothetical protein